MEIKGKDKFLAQIGALPQALREEVAKALQVSAEEATDLMRRFAPHETGKLRASIGYTFGEVPKGAISSAPQKPKTARAITMENARSAKLESDLAVSMYAGGGEAFYARFQEFGFQSENGIVKNPFFYPGYRLSRKRAMSRLSRAMRNGMKKAVGK